MTMIDPNTSGAPLSTEAVSFAPTEALREWHDAIGLVKHADNPIRSSRRAEDVLRLALIEEEFREVQDELLDFINGEGDRAKLAKELADQVYVAFAAADVHDIPLERVFNAVHASNMTKVGADGKVSRREDGKILKGPHYQPPNLESVFPGVSD